MAEIVPSRHGRLAYFYSMIQQPPPKQIRSWVDAEQNAAAWMRYWGFADARVTAAGSDAGVDVRSSRAVAQVKFEARQVGRPQLQNLVGARGRAQNKELLFFSGAGYSAHAVDYAAEMDVALFEYGLDGSIKAKNGPARHLIRTAASRRFEPVGQDRPEPSGEDRPSKRSRWVFLGLAALFWWGFLRGLFRTENFETMDGIFGGFTILALALLFSWLSRRAFRICAESQGEQR